MDVQKVTAISEHTVSTKPIKLRSACNQCFSAKVRCDGNKAGCIRCSEKRLPCKYSESRVGKVVGKRRKRPVDDSIGMVNSEAWILNDYFASQSIPSPATTNTSDENLKRSCTSISWESLIADDQTQLTFDDNEDTFQSLDMSESRSFSFTSEMPAFGTNGLPTPTLSPPQFRYLSPMALETRPVSQQSSRTVDAAKLLPPRLPASAYRTPEPQQPEDEEMVCIKLLAHLKKHSGEQHQSLDGRLSLIRKSYAAVHRIMKSKTVRSDYSCHLLLSSIMVHLVTLCERSCKKQSEESKTKDAQEVLPFDANSEYFNPTFISEPSQMDSCEALKTVIKDIFQLCSTTGDLLKRKPLNGFQTLGRHECLHVDLGQRLKASLALLQ